MQASELYDLIRRVEAIDGVSGTKLWTASQGRERLYVTTRLIGKAYLDLSRRVTVLEYISPAGHAGPMLHHADEYRALLAAFGAVGYPAVMPNGKPITLRGT